MKSALKTPLFFLFFVLLYFPSGFLYINESDFLFEKLTVAVLFAVSVAAFAQRGIEPEGRKLAIIFVSAMLLPALINISDLSGPDGGIGDSVAQILRLFIYVGVARYVYTVVKWDFDRRQMDQFAIAVIRTAVYGQILILLMRLTPLGAELDSIFLSKTIVGLDDGINVVKFDGSLGNPNYLGYMLCLVAFAITWSRNLFSRAEFVILLVLTVGMALVCGSRTASIVLALQMALSFPVGFLFLALGGLPMLELIAQVNDRQYELFDAILNSGNVETFDIRRDLVRQGLGYIEQRPLFGYGYRTITMTDNFYITHLVRYGLVGLLTHLVIILHVVRRFSPSIHFMSLFLIPVMLFNYSGAFIDNFRLFLFTTVFFFASTQIPEPIRRTFRNWRTRSFRRGASSGREETN